MERVAYKFFRVKISLLFKPTTEKMRLTLIEANEWADDMVKVISEGESRKNYKFVGHDTIRR